MSHRGYESDNGEHSEAAVMYLHSVLQVCAWLNFFFLSLLSIAFFSPAICVCAKWDCSGTYRGTLEGKRRHRLARGREQRCAWEDQVFDSNPDKDS